MHPCIAANARDPSRAPAGPIDRRPPVLKGTPERTARILRAAEAEAEQSESTSIAAKPLPQKEKSLWELWERLQPRCFCAQDARRSSTGVPLRPGERVEDQPEGARARCARVRCGPWMDRQRTPPPDRAVSGQEPADRAAGGVFSLGDFSLDKQREVTGPQGCGTNTHGCGSVIAKNKSPSKTKDTAKAPSPYSLPQAREGKAIHRDAGRTYRDVGGSSRRTRAAEGHRKRAESAPREPYEYLFRKNSKYARNPCASPPRGCPGLSESFHEYTSRCAHACDSGTKRSR